MKTKAILHLFIVILAFTLISGTAPAATRTWELPTGTGDWFDPLNWDGQTTVPTTGDDVVINAGSSVILSSSTPELASLSLAGTMIFTNWNTSVSATTVTIASGGVMTLPPAFTDTQMSNNVVIVCSNLTVASGGIIDADNKGYAGRDGNGYGPGYGANAGQGWGGGAGHGGQAYKQQLGGAISYGSASAPVAPGSSGFGQNNPGFAGGGVIRIDASGDVTVDGIIRADAEYRTVNNGGGAGGSIWITCHRLLGAGGRIFARGSNGLSSSNGNGAGGRIAIHYDSRS